MSSQPTALQACHDCVDCKLSIRPKANCTKDRRRPLPPAPPSHTHLRRPRTPLPGLRAWMIKTVECASPTTLQHKMNIVCVLSGAPRYQSLGTTMDHAGPALAHPSTSYRPTCGHMQPLWNQMPPISAKGTPGRGQFCGSVVKSQNATFKDMVQKLTNQGHRPAPNTRLLHNG